MPPVERHSLLQKATYWEFVRHDKYGAPIVKQPVEISCRFVAHASDKNAAKDSSVSDTGRLISTNELVLGSIVRLGNMETVPEAPDNLFSITGTRNVEDVKGRVTRHSATLAKHSNNLPEVTTNE